MQRTEREMEKEEKEICDKVIDMINREWDKRKSNIVKIKIIV